MSNNGNGGSATSLAVYERIADPLTATKVLGESIYRSGMFGCAGPSQGEVLALECLSRGLPPLSLAEKYHIIDGKLSMRSDAMLAEFQRLGGKSRIVSRTHDLAAVELTWEGVATQFALSWEDAQKEAFPWTGKAGGKRELKKNWATPRARMQMLWARAVSDGVRAVCPMVNSGRYAPEEFDQVEAPANGIASVVLDAVVCEAAPATPAAMSAAAELPAAASPTPAEAPLPLWRQVFDAFAAAGVTPEQRDAILRKRGVATERSLTGEQCQEILERLAAKSKQPQAEAPAVAAPEPAPQPAPLDARLRDPVSPETQRRILELLKQAGAVDPTFAASFKSRFHATGRAKLAELTEGEGLALAVALETRALEDFFARSLAPREAATAQPPADEIPF